MTMEQRDHNTAPLGDWKQRVGTHHCDGGVKLSNVHSAGRVLAVEAFIRQTATVIGLHCRLRSVGIQVNEFLTWTDRQGDINRKNHVEAALLRGK